eukprot:gene1712-1871_t
MHILFKIPLYLLGFVIAQASPLWGSILVQFMGRGMGMTVRGESGANVTFESWVPHNKRDTFFVYLYKLSGTAPWAMFLPIVGCFYVFYPPLAALALLSHHLLSI